MRLITEQAIAMRIFVRKQERLKNWRRSAGESIGGAIGSSGYKQERPRVSVCMAAYNGARYIMTQLTSILSQLDRADELIIVDDNSNDSTVEVILQLGDPRVRLYRHDANKGVVITFEEALLRATGDILFLCDDDDVWAPEKVDRFLEAFARNQNAQLVISRVRVIDEFGIEYSDERLGRGGKAAPGFWQNIFANHYQGSAMAIRASFLGSIVPFPRNKAFLHDVWIGTRNDLLGGKTVYLNEKLLLYRRHSNNATRAKSLLQKLRTRLDLLFAHALYALRSAAS
jgi:glycosyltransferase involved in cell wall biosynthesis